MNSETILKTTVLDIIFENRNKLYGAYMLRKFYKNRLFGALFCTIGAASVLSAFTFIPEKKIDFIPAADITIYNIAKPVKPMVKKELPKQLSGPSTKPKRNFLIPILVDDKIKPDSIQQVRPTEVIGFKNVNISENDKPANFSDEIENSSGGVKIGTNLSERPGLLVPVENPDVQAAYPGGIKALKIFLERNLVNPTEMEQGEMVAVNVQFVVGYDGKLQDFTLIKDGGAIFNKEVIRVLKKMPPWIPGKSNGQNVPVYFVIPIKFVPAD